MLTARNFTLSQETFRDVDALRRAMSGLTNLDGWAEYASGITARNGARKWESGDGATGFPIAGEWADGATSWSLRTLGDGWVLAKITESDGSGRVVDHQHVSDIFSDAKLRYRVLWMPVSTGTPSVDVWTPSLSRFVGFGD